MARRLQAMGLPQYQDTINENGRWSGVLNWAEKAGDLPLRQTKPRGYFVNSMSDLFHESIPANWLIRVWDVMWQKSEHTFLILTKRAELMAERVQGMVNIYGVLPNVWLGVSAENQAAVDSRIPHLVRTPARGRFLSCEPLLEGVDLGLFGTIPKDSVDGRYLQIYNRIDWIIAGGESGPNARQMHPDWARAIRDQAQAAQIPFFFKQMSKKAAIPDDLLIREMPEFSKCT
jgi:protein gp37